LPISNDLISLLHSHHIRTVDDLTRFSAFELGEILGISQIVAVDLINCATVALASPLTSSWDVYEQLEHTQRILHFLSTNTSSVDCVPIPDAFGLHLSSINEIIGVEAHTRSQLCMTAVASTVLPPSFGGMGSGVVYLQSSVYLYQPEYLQDVLQARIRRVLLAQAQADTSGPNITTSASDIDALVRQCLSRVIPVTVPDAGDITAKLAALGPHWLDRDIRLLVIDGLEDWYGSASALDRHKALAALGSQLKTLCNLYEMAVLATSAAVDTRGRAKSRKYSSTRQSGESGVPVTALTAIDAGCEARLGVSWNHSVTNRWNVLGELGARGRWFGELWLVKSASERLGQVQIERFEHGFQVSQDNIRRYINR
jgi:hypothetical protein